MAFHRVDNFLDEAIRSILFSTDIDLELIAIADGAAKKESAKVRQKYSNDSRVLVINNPGSGRVEAVNFGISLASHDFIGRMDSDDVSCEKRLARQARYLASHPKVVVVGGSIQLIDASGHFGDIKKYKAKIKSRLRKPIHPPVAQPATMFRKSSWSAVGGYRDKFALVEDQDLWLRMLEQGEIHNLKEVVLHYRVHQDQLSQKHLDLQIRDATLAGLESVLGEVPETLRTLSSEVIGIEWLKSVLTETNFLSSRQKRAALRLIGDFVMRHWKQFAVLELAEIARLLPIPFVAYMWVNIRNRLFH